MVVTSTDVVMRGNELSSRQEATMRYALIRLRLLLGGGAGYLPPPPVSQRRRSSIEGTGRRPTELPVCWTSMRRPSMLVCQFATGYPPAVDARRDVALMDGHLVSSANCSALRANLFETEDGNG